MQKQWDKLETLATPVRFTDKKTPRRTTSKSETPITSFFLQKRERLDSDDLKESLKGSVTRFFYVNSDDPLADFESHLEVLRRRKSSIFMTTEHSHHVFDICDTKIDECVQIQPNENVPGEAENASHMEVDGFNFNLTKVKKLKVSRFVMKLDKAEDQLSLDRAPRVEIKVSESYVENLDINSGSSNEDKQTVFVDQQQRLKIKVAKVGQYWKRDSIMIPNVFRTSQAIEYDSKNVFEFQDYSRKSVLATMYAQKPRVEDDTMDNIADDLSDYPNDTVSFTHKKSFCEILGFRDDSVLFDR